MPKPFFSHATVFGQPGLIVALQTITTATTIVNGDEVISVDAAGGAFALTLPFAASRRGRELYIVKANNVNNVTVTAQGADVIGFAGAATVILTLVDTVLHLVSDGVSRWIRLS